jgi:hypothetical protein
MASVGDRFQAIRCLAGRSGHRAPDAPFEGRVHAHLGERGSEGAVAEESLGIADLPSSEVP